ncbi:MAG: aldehyde dehydrogenase family protein, partial [Acidimicrobiia bacterium]
MKTINPTTGELVAEYPDHTWSEVEARLEAAQRAFQEWRRVPIGT